MRKFNLQEAKEGKPVCTRDGRKARILCFDRKHSKFPIVALVTNHNQEDYVPYDINGKFMRDTDTHSDLMMAPIKKTGWVNIYETSCDTRCCGYAIWGTKEEALKHKEKSSIATIKVKWKE